MYRSEGKKELPVSRPADDHDTTSKPQPVPPKPEGWDPFQVWRDRILKPRERSGRTARPQVPRKPQKS
jgi:hypothetical protein